MSRFWNTFYCMLVILILSACSSSGDATPTNQPVAEPDVDETAPAVQSSTPTSSPTEENSLESATRFDLVSDAFLQGFPIPEDYTCKGRDISPQLTWDAPPAGTQSLVLIMDDPDAPGGTWTHWVLYNIPAGSYELPQAVFPYERLDDGSLHGKNSWDIIGYRGPCPPSGTHRYFFHLYALDTELDLPGSVKQSQLENAMAGHIIGYAELMGTFQK
jgi:hypothetical protein